MSRTTTVRKYGKSTRKQAAELLFAQLPRTPVKDKPASGPELAPADNISELAEQLEATTLEDTACADEKAEAHVPDHAPGSDTPAGAKSEATREELPEEADQQSHHGQEEDLEE